MSPFPSTPLELGLLLLKIHGQRQVLYWYALHLDLLRVKATLKAWSGGGGRLRSRLLQSCLRVRPAGW